MKHKRMIITALILCVIYAASVLYERVTGKDNEMLNTIARKILKSETGIDIDFSAIT